MTDDYEAFGALAKAFLAYANHADDCAGGDGTVCACGYLQAWAEARSAKTLAERLAHQHEGTTELVDGVPRDGATRLVLNPAEGRDDPQTVELGTSPIPLSAGMLEAIRTWAADDRLWGSRSATEFNLCTFARVILKAQTDGE